MNQLKLDANTSKWHQARENARGLRASHDWFYMYFEVVKKPPRVFLTDQT